MLDPILQSLREVDGVRGAMVIDSSTTVIAHCAHAIYDRSMLQQVARSIIGTVESVQLLADDWDAMSAQFDDGKLLLRRLRNPGPRPQLHLLAVITDASVNVAFLGVALRVASSKLIAALEAGPAAPSTGPMPPPPAMTSAVTAPPAAAATAEPARTSRTWSSSKVGSSILGMPEAAGADAVSSAYLTACAKALTTSVGPMARLFMREALRKICGDRPFTNSDGPALLAQLAATIRDADDRAKFQHATSAL